MSRLSLGVLLISAAAFVIFSIHRISGFFPIGDDFGVLLNSSTEFHPDPKNWFINGWSNYFSTFPEFAKADSGFIRPLINLSIYIDSKILGESGEFQAYIIANHAYVVTFCLLAAIYIWSLSKDWAISALSFSILLLSVSFDRALTEIAYRTTVIMSICMTAFFFFLWQCTSKNRGGLSPLFAVLFALGSILAHELAIVYLVFGTGIIAGFTVDSIRRAARTAIPTGIALSSWLMLRQLLPPDARQSYVMSRFSDLSTVGLVKKLARLPTAFTTIPIPAYELDDLLRAAQGERFHTLLLVGPIILANLALLSWIFWNGTRRMTVPILCFGALLVVLGLVAPDERHFPCATLLFISLFVLLAKAEAASVVLLGIAVISIAAATMRSQEYIDSSEARREQYRAIVAAMRAFDVDRVFLINDLYGGHGARAMLQMAAAEAGRVTTDNKVVNSVSAVGDSANWSFQFDCHKAGWSFFQLLPPSARPIFPGVDLNALHIRQKLFQYELTWNRSLIGKAISNDTRLGNHDVLPAAGPFRFSVSGTEGNDLIFIVPPAGGALILRQCAW